MSLPVGQVDATFKAFRKFNDPALHRLANLRHRAGPRATWLFTTDLRPDQVARVLCQTKAIDIKELLESFEFYARVRRRLRCAHMVDLCCGHGLTGLLFGLLERSVERVTLIDNHRPPSFQLIFEALCELGPYLADKVEYLEQDIQTIHGLEHEPGSLALIGVHACGARTDRCIDAALALQAPIAVMPCCYTRTARAAPKALHKVLGRALTTDIHRTYRLEAAGYQVDWSAIPRAITPMNRVMVAWHPNRTSPSTEGPHTHSANDENPNATHFSTST